MNRPWMPLYVGDYLGDTGHLTTAQHGAYLLLLMHYWRKGELPVDDRQLSKITKLPLRTWREYRPTLQDFFYEGWKHKRIDAELQKMLCVSQKRAIAGQKGGIGSALTRMRLEDASRSGRAPPRAIAAPPSSPAQANADHSHAHSHQSLLQARVASGDDTAKQLSEKSAVAISPELAAYVVRRKKRSDERSGRRIQFHLQGSNPTWHGPNATGSRGRKRFMTGDRRICRAMRK